MALVTVPTAGQHGLVADQPAQELPVNAWSRVENMRFRGGKAERMGGHQLIFDAPSVTPYHLVTYEVAGARYVVHCGLSAVFADNGTTRSNITGTAPTGAAADRWTSCVLNGVLVLNNGKDVPGYWGGTGTLASLTGWNSAWKCRSMGAFKAYLVAFGMTKSGTEYPHQVKWSHAADPGTVPTSWDETDETKGAGEVDLAETTDQAVDQLPLGDANILYKQRSMYAMRFIGGTQIFEFRRLPGNYGMLARGCAAVTPKGHVVLANGDIVLHDGVSEPQSIVSDKLKETFFQLELDADNSDKCCVVANPARSEVWVCFPEVGYSVCTAALVWNWDSNTWGRRDLPNVTHATSGVITYTAADSFDSGGSETFDDDTLAFNQDEFGPTESRLLLASTAPALYIADSSSSFAGTAIQAVLERTGIAFDDPEVVKTIKSLVPRFTAPEGTVIYITFGSQMDAEGAVTWGDRITYTVGSTRKADSFATGRFIAIRIETEGGPKWSLKSYTADIVPRGMY